MNETIREALECIDPIVFYGQAGNLREDVLWNYIVYFRERIEENQNKTGSTLYFHVAIVRENEVPEGLEQEVIKAIKESVPGARVSGDIQYDYAVKPNTGAAVEVMDIVFAKPRKGCGICG